MPQHQWRFPESASFVLSRVRAPLCLTPGVVAAADGDGLATLDIVVRNGRIGAILPAGVEPFGDLPRVACDNGIALPRLVDMHTHLDKGHIWSRRANPDGTHWGARTNVMADREANWNADDVRARMEFALACAHAHGTSAVRTHIDSLGKQAGISWPVFAQVREAWKDRIALQAVALFPIDLALDDEAQFNALVATVATHGGVLGGMTYLAGATSERSHAALARVFAAASAHGLDLDFHVDESDSADARSLDAIARMALDTRFKGRIVAGHCCSLALAPDAEIADTVARVADAGVAIVSLPMCNMYLMGRTAGRTPRWRGVTVLHEFAAAGATVAVASDNTRDPFYAYGDLDLVEVYREAVRILQLDHTHADWPRIVASTPAQIMGLPEHGVLKVGGPADLLLLRARSMNEFLARPQNDRAVLARGRAVDTSPPDYRELDAMVGAPV